MNMIVNMDQYQKTRYMINEKNDPSKKDDKSTTSDVKVYKGS